MGFDELGGTDEFPTQVLSVSLSFPHPIPLRHSRDASNKQVSSWIHAQTYSQQDRRIQFDERLEGLLTTGTRTDDKMALKILDSFGRILAKRTAQCQHLHLKQLFLFVCYRSCRVVEACPELVVTEHSYAFRKALAASVTRPHATSTWARCSY